MQRTWCCAWTRGKRVADIPATMIEPRTPIRQTERFVPEQVADGALQSNCRRVAHPDRRKRAVRTRESDDADLVSLSVDQCHVDRVCLTPKTKQCPMPTSKLIRGRVPQVRRYDSAGPGAMHRNPSAAVRYETDNTSHVLHRHPSNPATFWNHATKGGGR